MHLDLKQINELYTGVRLETELVADKEGCRKFLTILGYQKDSENNVSMLSNVLNKKSFENIYFELRCYELAEKHWTNPWDVTYDDLESDIYQEDIKGIENLEKELGKYLSDYSVLKPEWYCDDIL